MTAQLIPTAIDPTHPIAPTAGLIASLTVRPWIDHTADGKTFAPMLITHPPGRRDVDTANAIEARMRGVADALGAAPAHAPLPYVGARVAVHQGVVLVRFDDTLHALAIRPGRWTQVVRDLGQVLLIVGLDPLQGGAHGAEIDQYIESEGVARRLFTGIAGVADSPRRLPPVSDVVARRH